MQAIGSTEPIVPAELQQQPVDTSERALWVLGFLLVAAVVFGIKKVGRG